MIGCVLLIYKKRCVCVATPPLGHLRLMRLRSADRVCVGYTAPFLLGSEIKVHTCCCFPQIPGPPADGAHQHRPRASIAARAALPGASLNCPVAAPNVSNGLFHRRRAPGNMVNSSQSPSAAVTAGICDVHCPAMASTGELLSR